MAGTIPKTDQTRELLTRLLQLLSDILNSINTDFTDLSKGTTEFIVGTQTKSTNAWTGTSKSSELYDGKRIIYLLPYAGSGSATLNLTLSTGGKTGAKNVYRYGTTRISTQYGANYYIPMTYNATKNAWYCDADYDTNQIDRLRFANAVATITEDTTAGKLICGDSSGYKMLQAGVSFDINYPLLYDATARTAGADITNLYMVMPSLNVRTIIAGLDVEWVGDAHKILYVKGNLNGNIFTVSSTPVTTETPNTADGFAYLPIGIMYSTYQVNLNLLKAEPYGYADGRFSKLTGDSGKINITTKTDGVEFTDGNDNVIYKIPVMKE